ncbi:MAG: membrane dipeptidase [Clostridia bacterium]|nr:membrane dipeptidase [Clostridia bacterium]
MIIADMHCDSLMAVSPDRGLLNKYNHSNKDAHLQFFAHFIPKERQTADIRLKRLMNSFNIYLSECERLGIKRICDCRDLTGIDSGVYSLLSVEGGGGLFATSPELDVLYRGGLRVMGMVWDGNELGSGAWDSEDRGLTKDGIALAERCSEMGIILDVSHLSDKSFDQLFSHISYPIIATHSNFRAVTPSPRNLTDDMARRIANRGGVIGLNLYPGFLSDKEASTDDILRHAEYGLNLVGEEVLAFGFDLDGTSGKYPTGLDESSSIHDRVVELLLTKYKESTVEKIAGKNVLRFLSENLY